MTVRRGSVEGRTYEKEVMPEEEDQLMVNGNKNSTARRMDLWMRRKLLFLMPVWQWRKLPPRHLAVKENIAFALRFCQFKKRGASAPLFLNAPILLHATLNLPESLPPFPTIQPFCFSIRPRTPPLALSPKKFSPIFSSSGHTKKTKRP